EVIGARSESANDGTRASPLIPQDFQHLGRRAFARGDGAVNRSGAPLWICGLACEKEGATQRPRERGGCLRSTNYLIAVRASRKRVVLPVVHPDAVDQATQLSRRDPELMGERRNRQLTDFLRRELRQRACLDAAA